ncbi:sarcosine oxidase [Cobetia marina]|uniref:sarcosine oxidase n=1 Tax=Cobetia marina TaxID=28258 RepID=UPI001166C63E|nr:sarcosine oxidase [Cobetia marina]GED42500.1 sarcosine oxidase [Cobetia marina]
MTTSMTDHLDGATALARCALPASLTGASTTDASSDSVTVTVLSHCALADMSALGRAGVRGREAADWLASLGFTVPDTPNMARLQTDGSWLVRLSVGEFLQLTPAITPDAGVAELPLIAQADDALARGRRVHSLPRRDSHAWFSLSGSSVPTLMAKLCGVDLRSEAFPPGSVAQTSVARTNAIIVNVGSHQCPCFHLLFDIASSHYLWGVMLDAMREYSGQTVTAAALLAHHHG